MKIYGVIQARMNSSRFPGKVLKEIAGKPLLEYLIERVRQAKELGEVVVATSKESTDQPIRDYCAEKNVLCYEGDLEDVAKRFLDLSKQYLLDAFVRINGDSPFMDPSVIDLVVSAFKSNHCHLATNVLNRTYPKGQSVEVVLSSAMDQAYKGFEHKSEHEHVTQYFYKHSEDFKIQSCELENEDFSAVNLCVDDQDSFEEASRIVSLMERNHSQYGWRDILALKQSGVKLV